MLHFVYNDRKGKGGGGGGPKIPDQEITLCSTV